MLKATGHAIIKATCEKPETCSKCGATFGAALGHQWQAATCTSPQKCKSCGATQGTSLGHTTRYGTCTRCGQVVKELATTANDIMNGCSDGIAALTDATNYVNAAYKKYKSSGRTTGLATGVTAYFRARREFAAALELCGDTTEFQEIKGIIVRILNRIDSTVSGTVTTYGDYRDLPLIANCLTLTRDLSYGELVEAVEVFKTWPK
ncbi:MAG: hypothetical protein IKI41_08780 [Clostridia bacterium]|nr:hypothetical protein [Clostridia bacterium]